MGAGAHSYDGQNRSWNPDDLEAYVRGTQSGSLVREMEHLSAVDRYNEMIMLGLRTDVGILYSALHTPEKALPYLQRGFLRVIIPNVAPIIISSTPDVSPFPAISHNARLVATQSGWHILNTIIEDLME